MPPFYFLTFAKVSVSVSKKFGLKKVSVSVSKTFGLEKKSRYRSRKHLVSKKSLGIGLENIWSQKKSRYRSRKYLVSKKSLGLGNFGLEKKSRYRSWWNILVSSLSGAHHLFHLILTTSTGFFQDSGIHVLRGVDGTPRPHHTDLTTDGWNHRGWC